MGAAGPGRHPPAASIVDAHGFGEAADAPSHKRLLRATELSASVPPPTTPLSARTAKVEDGVFIRQMTIEEEIDADRAARIAF